MATDTEKNKDNLLLEMRLLIDRQLTWGELIDFVATAQKYGNIERSEEVFHERSPDRDETVALVAWVDAEQLIPQPPA